MTEAVTRHRRPGVVDVAAVQRLAEDVKSDAQRLGASTTVLAFAVDESLTLLEARLIIDPQASELPTWEAAVTAMQVRQAAFAAAVRTEGVVRCRIVGEVRSIPATGPQFYANAGNWLSAFWLAIVCRDQVRMTELCEVPLEVLRASGVRGDEYVYSWIDVLQTYWLERPGLVEKLGSAIDNSFPEVATIAPRDLLQNVLYPPISLFCQFLRKDHGAFNVALTEALQLHRAYWTADDERANDFAGVVSFSLLAITCLAHDAGFPIDVESDYLPKHLLERDWVGEFEV
ncbi:immunity 49 family protein [Streptomyces sp. NPDC059575]|uniref:immunity 49 family protein n=1 Tax=Streptomyces sp. NPDC059575 TaxID=3346872 RepID=UPI0036A81D70